MATWTALQQASNAGTSGSPAFPSNVAAGSLLIAVETGPSAFDPAGVPSDTRGTTYTRLRRISDATNDIAAVVWYGIAPSAGANTVTFPSSTSFDSYIIAEYSVDAGTISLRAETGSTPASHTSATDNISSGTATSVLSDSLVIGVSVEDGADVTIAAGSNFVLDEQTNLEGFTGNPVSLEHRTAATPGSYAATFTANATGRGYAFVGIFETDAAGSGAVELAPTADSVDGTWTDQAAGTALAAAIDETTPSDTDYIQSVSEPQDAGCRVKLASGTDPASSSGHIVRWRIRKDAPGGSTVGMTVKLYQGGGNSIGAGTLIASFTRADVDGSAWTTYDETLSGAEADAITNYADLYLEFFADVP
jgi:hypothetical protein